MDPGLTCQWDKLPSLAMWWIPVRTCEHRNTDRLGYVATKHIHFETEGVKVRSYHHMKSESLHKRRTIGGTHAKDLTFLTKRALIAKQPTGRVYGHLRWFLCFVHTFRYRLNFWQMWARSRFSQLTWWLWFSSDWKALLNTPIRCIWRFSVTFHHGLF